MMKSQLDLYLGELAAENSAETVFPSTKQLQKNELPPRETKWLRWLEFVHLLAESFEDVLYICYICSSILLGAVFSGKLSQWSTPQRRFPSASRCAVVVMLFWFCGIDLAVFIHFEVLLHLVSILQQYVIKLILGTFLLASVAHSCKLCASWKLQEARYRVELSIRYINRLQSLTLGKGVSAPLPPLWLLSNESTIDLPSQTSGWTHVADLKRQLWKVIDQLEQVLNTTHTRTSSPLEDVVAISVQDLLSKSRNLLRQYTEQQSTTVECSEPGALLMWIFNQTWSSLGLLAAVNQANAVTTSILRPCAASAHRCPSSPEAVQHSGVLLVDSQIPLLRSLRQSRNAIEDILAGVIRAEKAVHETIGTVVSLSVEQIDQLEQLIANAAQSCIRDSSGGVEGDSTSELSLSLYATVEAFQQFKTKWNEVYHPVDAGGRNHTADKLAPLAHEHVLERGIHAVDKTTGETHSRNAETGVLESGHDARGNDHRAITTNDSKEADITEVFVATVGLLPDIVKDTDADLAKKKDVLFMEEQRIKYVTKSLLGELHQSLIQRHTSSIGENQSSHDGRPHGVIPGKKQRVRDFDTSSVREEDALVSSIMVAASEDLRSEVNDDSSLSNPDDLQGVLHELAVQLEPEKQLVRSELRSVLGAIAVRWSHSANDCVLGDDEDD